MVSQRNHLKNNCCDCRMLVLCHADLQKDPDRLERLAENCLKFNKGKCRSCTWGRKPPGSSTGWGWPLGSSSGEKDLVDTELSMSQQCPGDQKGRWDPGMHQEEHWQELKAGDPAPFLSPGEATTGVSSSRLLRTRLTWSSWSKANGRWQRWWGDKSNLLRGKAEGAGPVQPGEEMTKGTSQMSVSVCQEGVKRVNQALLYFVLLRTKRQKLMNRKSHLNMSRSFFSGLFPCSVTDCPEGLWSFSHWRYSRTVLT